MDNPLKQIFSKGLSMISHSSGHSVVGIDIGTSSIKVVQLKKKGSRAVLETYGALSLGPYGNLDVGTVTNLSADKLSQALIDVIRESKITTHNGALSIPSAASLLFLINLPSAIDEKQLPTIVPTEARKYIPVPISEVSLDFWVIPKKEESIDEKAITSVAEQALMDKTEVLIAVIHNDILQKYQEIVKKASVNSSFFEIEVFSAIRSTFSHELGSVLLVDIGASRTKLSVVEYGIVRSFHIINRGGVDMTNALSKSLNIPFTKAEEMKREFGLFGSSADPNIAEILKLSVDYILAETKTTIANYEKKNNKTISKVILSGGTSLLKGFFEEAKDAFSTEVVLANPFSKVEAPAFLEHVLAATGPEFSVALGLAMRELHE